MTAKDFMQAPNRRGAVCKYPMPAPTPPAGRGTEHLAAGRYVKCQATAIAKGAAAGGGTRKLPHTLSQITVYLGT